MFTIQLTEEQLDLILESLETQAIHSEMDNRWSKAALCRYLATDMQQATDYQIYTAHETEL